MGVGSRPTQLADLFERLSDLLPDSGLHATVVRKVREVLLGNDARCWASAEEKDSVATMAGVLEADNNCRRQLMNDPDEDLFPAFNLVGHHRHCRCLQWWWVPQRIMHHLADNLVRLHR